MRAPFQGRRRLVAVAGTAVLALVAALVAVVASSTDAPVRTQSQMVAGTAENGQPVTLDTSVYLPRTVPAPAILLAHGFGGSKDDLADAARSLARRGYVVLAYSARGFGRSGGLVHLDAPEYEVADASKLISYLATLPQVLRDAPGDPRVGVAGPSYGGALGLLTAGHDRRIDAVAADITWNDLSEALFPNAAGDQPGVFKKQWAGVLFAAAPGEQPGACGRFAPDLCAAYQRAAATGEADAEILALLRAASPAGVLDRITAPTLLTQGERDSLFSLGQADANARGIAAHGTPVKEIWRSGGHDRTTSAADLVPYVDDWFGPVLQGRGRLDTSFEVAVPGSGISADTGQTVARSLRADDGATSRRTNQVAVAGPPQTIYAPAGGSPAAVTTVPGLGALLTDAAALSGAAARPGSAASPGSAAPSGPAALTGLAGLAMIPGQVAAFASAPLPTGMLVGGSSTITLQVTARDTTDATLFASLVVVDPDGGVDLPNGLVAPIRLTGLRPGVPKSVTVTLPGVVAQIPAGHRLVVAVGTTDSAYHLPTSPRGYTIALDGASVRGDLAVATIDGRLAGSGLPWSWLVVGAAAMALLLPGALVAEVRRRRRRRAVADGLETVPVVIEGLVKEYGDGYRAVDGVSFRVESGQVVGLLGPNGAGKTTALRVLMGLIRPTAGTVRLFGELVEPGAPVLSKVGTLVEGPGLLPHLSGRDNLRLFWAATGRPPRDARLDAALEIAGLGPSIERRVGTYSQGMRQRLAIAQAMLGLPELLVLDEPTNGLDPPQIAEMREVLRRYATTGRTVVISSHLLAEVEQTCTHVVVMHKGLLVAAGPVEEIVGAGGTQLAVANPEEAQRILAAAGMTSHVMPAQRSLEEVFLKMIGADQ
ncbi:alpha/beta fold hydrolase [Frankia sp. CNm7]|uniref:Alpha/beta fold hydrolase n=1 Tax=Frankia nepalensis TaxID=1836974 RepID=A0A937RDL8_9ACTN|nr:alpha/beta fold hydrolase [Frankia nepalensis]MBL7501435.1 alpha/beta fold hydrolase [Frankia nepalensis]MBL7510002.1 alpha/beta fold hydrolase [Frankia nepalensis]MBL7517148.1 alpha/beta fold hydrolase [Frankia nepalensis]MBL7627987.1 alpha/beta fold hydrolase [Frankia nepalensis]